MCGLLAALVWLPAAYGAHSEVRFQRVAAEHGLSQSSIHAMVQDRRGYLWIGTQYGLNRYDGYSFRVLTHDPEDPATLGDNRVKDLVLGVDGDIWVATASGLDRLDPVSGTIQRVLPRPGDRPDSEPLGDAMVRDDAGRLLVPTRASVYLLDEGGSPERLHFAGTPEGSVPEAGWKQAGSAVDADGRFWLADRRSLWRLDRDARRFERVRDLPARDDTVIKDSLAALDSGALAWTRDDGVHLIDPDSGRALQIIRPSQHGAGSDRVGAVAAGPGGSLWLTLPGALMRWHPSGDGIRVETLPAGAPSDDLHNRLELSMDGDGRVWLAGDFGLARMDPESGTLRQFRHRPGRANSLVPTARTSGYRLLADSDGTIWIGSGLGGLSHYVPQAHRFVHLHADSPTPDTGLPPSNIVRSVVEVRSDGGREVWTGLDTGGIRVWRWDAAGRHEPVRHFHRAAESGTRRLPDDRVYALAAAPGGRVWAGAGGTLTAIDPAGDRVVHRLPLEGQVRIRALQFAGGGRLLAATRDAVYDVIVAEDGGDPRVRHRHQLALPGVRDNDQTFDLLLASSGTVLVASGGGLWRVLPDGTVEHAWPAGRPGTHPRNYVFSLAESPAGTYWLGTRTGGLLRVRWPDAAGAGLEVERILTAADGLPDNTVYAIQADAAGALWLSSNQGIARWRPADESVLQFTMRDGLQELEFNNAVSARGRDGDLYFGGINGVNVFDPEKVVPHPTAPRVHLQEVRINGEVRPLPADGSPPALALDHDRNSLTLEYVGLHFVDPRANRYAYRLEGLETGWVDAGDLRQARYPDLSPGRYRFHVRAANSDGVWSEPRLLAEARVHPPPWLSPWAFAAYALAVVLVLYALWLAQHRRRRQLEAMVAARTAELAEQKDLVARQAAELEDALEARTTLFANVSHEFRTPLTLIHAGLDRLEAERGGHPAISLGRRYLRRLLRLVEQILDLSRLRVAPPAPAEISWPLEPVTAMTVEAFRSLAAERDIELVARLESGWQTRCHQEHYEKILLNLITNAIKFSPQGGRVTVTLRGCTEGVELAVADRGPGIPAADRERIFERFHRLPAAESGRIQGAGVGLALVREAVEVNGGSIRVRDRNGPGSRFVVRLPASRMADSRAGEYAPDLPATLVAEDLLALDLAELADRGGEYPGASGTASTGELLGTVLVVEDNPDLRVHLRDLLAGRWRVLEATDGRQALDLAAGSRVDVVVSDVMMPALDGLELLRRLRQAVETSHIPVLLLTARQDEATRLEGLTLAADDFLAKPFEPRELLLRLERMIANRRRLQARLRKDLEEGVGRRHRIVPVRAGPEDVNPRDRDLLERLARWLERHHSDPEIGVAEMADAVAMDIRTLQRKVKALTGSSPGAYLRGYRLACARQMLADSDRPVGEIALECGFSSAQYFSRLFRRVHGLPPERWRRKTG